VSAGSTLDTVVRRARTTDVRAIRAFIDLYADDRILLSKPTVTLYEDIQEFWVAEVGDTIAGCGALHVMWEDLAEVRTLAVDPAFRGRGVGGVLLRRLLDQARALGVSKVFCLTFEVQFFRAHGFTVMEGAPVHPDVLRGDALVVRRRGGRVSRPRAGEAQHLGNTRMILHL
jgi:amino-acid N-acetyltransferase